MIKIISELMSFISILAQQQLEKLGIQVWKIAIGIGLALISVLLILVSICFFGCSLYQQLVLAVGVPMAASIAGGFFLLISLILLIISKKLIKKS